MLASRGHVAARLGWSVLGLLLMVGQARAQRAGPAQPDPATLRSAILLVHLMEPEPKQEVRMMEQPIRTMLGHTTHLSPDRIRILVDEAIAPLILAHVGEIEAGIAHDYAMTLSKRDIDAAIHFYRSAPGHDFAIASPVLAGLRAQRGFALMQQLQPEIIASILAVIKRHGWANQQNRL